MIKILETRVGVKDLGCSVVISESVAVDKISSALEFEVQQLNDSLLIGFSFFVKLLKDPIVPGLGFSAVVTTRQWWWTPVSYGLWLEVSTIID